MSRYRTGVSWSAGMLATAAAAVLTASATLPGSAAHLEVDGGVLQVFVLDGPADLPGPPGGIHPGPPGGVPPGPPEGVPDGPPEGVPGGSSDTTGPPADDSVEPPGSQAPSDRPSDEQQKPDSPSDKPDKHTGEQADQSDPPSSGQDPQQQRSQPDATASTTTMSAAESEVRYENCAQAREADAAPLDSDDPGYRTELDDDRDGRACEQGES